MNGQSSTERYRRDDVGLPIIGVAEEQQPKPVCDFPRREDHTVGLNG